jgi:hypothetical protein
MSSAIADSASSDDTAGIGDANHEASSVRWLGRWCQNENRPIGMISVIATSDMNPTKPPSTATVEHLLRKEHGLGAPEEEMLGPSKRSRVGTSETGLIEVPVRSVLPLDGS